MDGAGDRLGVDQSRRPGAPAYRLACGGCRPGGLLRRGQLRSRRLEGRPHTGVIGLRRGGPRPAFASLWITGEGREGDRREFQHPQELVATDWLHDPREETNLEGWSYVLPCYPCERCQRLLHVGRDGVSK